MQSPYVIPGLFSERPLLFINQVLNLAITEMCLIDDICNSYVYQDFQQFYNCRKFGRHGGGVMLLL